MLGHSRIPLHVIFARIRQKAISKQQSLLVIQPNETGLQAIGEFNGWQKLIIFPDQQGVGLAKVEHSFGSKAKGLAAHIQAEQFLVAPGGATTFRWEGTYLFAQYFCENYFVVNQQFRCLSQTIATFHRERWNAAFHERISDISCVYRLYLFSAASARRSGKIRLRQQKTREANLRE